MQNASEFAIQPLYSPLAYDEDMRPELELFLDRLSARVTSLRQHIAEANWRATRDMAQLLKGAANTLGYPELSHCAGGIEALAQIGQGRNPGELASTLAARVEALDHLCQRARAAFGGRSLRSSIP